MANDVVFTVPMIGAGFWTAITGDVFLPSLAGAAFAVYYRMERTGEGGYLIKDLIATGFMSFVIGIIAGPYVASQMPDGEGGVGVGALIASFVGTAILAKLNRIDWDLAEFIRGIAHSFVAKKK